jgi:uncharacterized protein YndB with AHSA1/START domain
VKNTGTLTVTTPTDRDIVMTRIFDAPRQLVFAALTQPELLRRWYGPRGYQLVQCEVDLRVGGAWRFVVRAPDASEMVLRGSYLEIDRPARLVNTAANEDCAAVAGSESLVTTILDEQAGRTTLTSTERFPSRRIRDAALNSGMEHGVAQGYDRLAETLVARQPRSMV